MQQRRNALAVSALPEANATCDGLCCVTDVEQLSGTLITKHLQQGTTRVSEWMIEAWYVDMNTHLVE
jgi:hypothetical protein